MLHLLFFSVSWVGTLLKPIIHQLLKKQKLHDSIFPILFINGTFKIIIGYLFRSVVSH